MITDKDLNKLATVFATKDDMKQAIDDSFVKFKDEVLTSNDKLSKKLDIILTEQKAITAAYKRLQERINYLEAVVKVLAEDKGLKFNPPSV